MQGTTIVCADSAFEQLVKPPKTVGGKSNILTIEISFKISFLAKFICPNSTCHRELGVVILLQRNVFGYVLQITALKFIFNSEKEPRFFKKWSLYQGHIEPL